MDRWPDAAALADAPKSDVITAWGQAWLPSACVAIAGMRSRQSLPITPTSCRIRTTNCLALPGIGDYTASAVM